MNGNPRKVFPPEMVERVKRLYYREEKGQVEIAADLGVTQKTIWRLMKNHGMKARLPGRRRKQKGKK